MGIPIKKLTIRGFKSIRELNEFELRPLNILIGGNGAGKSNFVDFFRFLREMVEGRLQIAVRERGGADRILFRGVKMTENLHSFIQFGLNGYYFFDLHHAPMDTLYVGAEQVYSGNPSYDSDEPLCPQGGLESDLKPRYLKELESGAGRTCFHDAYEGIRSWQVYHFHDTSSTAGMKRSSAVPDYAFLRGDASNLAAFLLWFRDFDRAGFAYLRKTIQLAIPSFDDFRLDVIETAGGELSVRFLWHELGSDYPLWPTQLSDGSLRFICLATALLQPNPPSTIVIDEPELGLHPHAIALLASLLRKASKRMQVIVSTQSVPLVSEFEPEDLIVVDREDGASTFKRLERTALTEWLEDYSLGELWEKNVLGGGPLS